MTVPCSPATPHPIYIDPTPVCQASPATGVTNGEVGQGTGQLWFANPEACVLAMESLIVKLDSLLFNFLRSPTPIPHSSSIPSVFLNNNSDKGEIMVEIMILIKTVTVAKNKQTKI